VHARISAKRDRRPCARRAQISAQAMRTLTLASRQLSWRRGSAKSRADVRKAAPTAALTDDSASEATDDGAVVHAETVPVGQPKEAAHVIRVPCTSCGAHLRFTFNPSTSEQTEVRTSCPRCTEYLRIRFRKHSAMPRTPGRPGAPNPVGETAARHGREGPMGEHVDGFGQVVTRTDRASLMTDSLNQLEEECLMIALKERAPGRSVPAFMPRSNLPEGTAAHRVWLPTHAPDWERDGAPQVGAQ